MCLVLLGLIVTFRLGVCRFIQFVSDILDVEILSFKGAVLLKLTQLEVLVAIR